MQNIAPFPELIDRKKCGKMEWRQKIKGEKTMSNKKGSAPPRYDEEFKKGAMALVTEKGMPLKSAAKDLGICPDTLRSAMPRLPNSTAPTAVRRSLKLRSKNFASS